PDPDRGWTMAALTGGLDFPAVKSSTVRAVMHERVDPVLWSLSRDFVGDTAETASLLWPGPLENDVMPPPGVHEVVGLLTAMTRRSVMRDRPLLLDRQDQRARYAVIMLPTGALSAGVSAWLARNAFALAFDVAIDEV